MMGADVLRTVDPLSYYRAHLCKGVRPDGRALLAGRKPQIRRGVLNTTDGSATLRVGKTVVLAGVQCEPTPPSDDAPGRGRVVVNFEIANVCSANASRGGGGGGGAAARQEREQAALVELLQRTASGGLVDLDSLCAVEGAAVWTCYCDVYVLEHDGNILDAALMAITAALSEVVLPRLTADGETGALTVAEERAVPLRIAAPLYPVSFGVLSDAVIMDPCAEEEALLSTTFTLLLSAEGEFRALHKPGGGPMPGSLQQWAEAARSRLPALAAMLAPQEHR